MNEGKLTMTATAEAATIPVTATTSFSCFSSSQEIENSLVKASREIQARNEITSILNYMIHDIEETTYINKDVQQKQSIKNLENEVNSLKLELNEYRAISEEEQKNRFELGDNLVAESFLLSVKLYELEKWKEDNFERIQRVDELKRSLERAEEKIREMKRTASLNMNAMRDPTLMNTSIVNSQKKENSIKEEEEEEKEIKEKNEIEVAKVEKEAIIVKDPIITLETLEGKMLLEIFSFLDPMDVLNCSQMSEAFYKKVDVLFGGSSAPAVEEPKPAPKVQKLQEPPRKKPTPAASATIVAIPPQPPVPKPTPTQTQTNTINPLSQMFARLQHPLTKKDSQSSISTTNTTTTTATITTTSQPPTSKQTQQPEEKELLNTTMANSMADKLSPSELSVIISMTERLRQKQNKLTALQTQVDDLTARLEGTESVKDVLIKKSRDMEHEHKQQVEKCLKLQQQNDADQEVITFLDSKITSLEQNLQQQTSKATKNQDVIDAMNSKYSKSLKVIEDMLEFERQEKMSQEKEWNVKKKILVKEVKHCRAQIVALQAERDAFYQQNLLLKKALLGGSSSDVVANSHELFH